MNNDTQRVLMVYPAIPDTFWSFRHSLSFTKKKSLLPPLGLITVAALMPPRYECELADLNIAPVREAQLQRADLVFVSAMMVQKKSFDEVVARCRALGKTVVAGGPYPTSSHDNISGVDHFVLDEGEITLPRFLHDWERACPQSVYRADVKPDVSQTPLPRYDLLDIDQYEMMSLQYSRGCPFNCEFCDIIEMFGHRMRVKTPSQMEQELTSLYQAGWRGGVFIVDDNFVGDKRKVKTFLAAAVQWQEKYGYPFEFSTEASIDLAQDEELLGLMRQARFTMVFLGIETPSRESLAETGKKQNLTQDPMISVRAIQSYGIKVTAGFIVGFDSDTEDIFDRQIEFIQRSGIAIAMVGLLQAFPHTRLYRRLQREKRLLGDATGDNTHNVEVNYIPIMDRTVLMEGYQKILRTIYRPKNYFDRAYVYLKRMPKDSVSRRTISIQKAIMPLLRSLWRQGLSSYGIHYFGFLLKTLLFRPRVFPNAVATAVGGHHFFQLIRQLQPREGKA